METLGGDLNILYSIYLSQFITDKEAVLLATLLNMTRNEIEDLKDGSSKRGGGSQLFFELCAQQKINIYKIINSLRQVIKDKEKLNKIIDDMMKEYKRIDKAWRKQVERNEKRRKQK